MKRALLIVALMIVSTAAQAQTTDGAGTAPTNAQLQSKVESQVRKLYALGPSFTVKAAAPKPSLIPNLLAVEVQVGIEGQVDTVTFYITKDGRHVVRGEVLDTSIDPFAATRAQLKTEGAPFKGPANAKVTVVEFSDFQCPTCRVLHQTLRAIVPLYPNVKFVFKDFPLAQIHPWALTAHQAVYCARQQDPKVFWKLHDMIYDKQELISATTAWDTMLDYAGQFGINIDTLKACMVSPETKAALEMSVNEGLAVKVANTPTVFINGRRLVGGDRQALEQFIQYELAATTPTPKQ